MITSKSSGLRLNRRALVLTSLAVAALLSGGAWLKVTQASRLRRAALSQAEQALDAGQVAKALRHLDHFLESSPDDLTALAIKAKLMAQEARDIDQIRAAAQVNDRLLRLDPDGKDAQATRRRLAELYIRYSDAIRGSSLARDAPEMASQELQYRSAEAVAREMVKADPSDGSGHRLLGMAVEARSSGGDARAAEQAARSYAESLRIDPRDVVAAERMAGLCRGILKDPLRADRVMDDLLRIDPRRLAVRLARFRYRDRFGDRESASAEMSEAVALAPTDSGVLLSAAGYASLRGDLKAARSLLDAIPADSRQDRRTRMIRGMIELTERRPEEAIEEWRKGLARTGGTDAEMNWWLAYVLLQTDRVTEAAPLVSQFCRLADPKSPQAQLLLAMLDEKSGRPLAAIAKLGTIKEKVGDSLRPALLQILGRSYEALWDDRLALDAYREASEADRADPAPRLAVARILEARSPGDAIDYLREEARTRTADPRVTTNLAWALLRREARLPTARRSWGEFDAAFAAASKASSSPATLARLQADRRLLSGNPSGALAALESAVLAEPREVSNWTSYASALDRQDRPEEALRTLDAATAPGAAGDRAAIRITRAWILTELGRGREGRDQLVKDVDKLNATDRAATQEALGRLLAAQGDAAAARTAFVEWARLSPESFQPRLALLDLAVAENDDEQVRSAVASIRAMGGPQDIVGRLCRVVEILRTVGRVQGDAARVADPAMAEAEKILDEVRELAPEAPSVAMLRGQLLESHGKVDDAAAEYRRAWDRGMDAALPRLVALLVRHRRVDELTRLRSDRPADARVERLLAEAARSLGDAGSVETLVGASAGAALPEARGLRAEALVAAGKVAEAEALLKARAEDSNGQEAAWLDLLRFQVRFGRSDAFASTIEAIKARVKARKPEVLEAGCLGIIGDRAGSERAIAAALKAYPDDPEVLVAAAGVARAAGRVAEAVAYIRRVLELDPKQVELARQLSVTLAQDARNPGEWRQAWESLEPESSDPEARLVRAYVLLRCPDAQRRKAAIAPLEALLGDLNADHPVARGARDYLIRLLVSEKQIDRAIAIAQTPATREFNPAAIATYVDLLILNRDLVQARKQLDRWFSVVPGDRLEARLRVRLLRAETPAADLASTLERAYLDRGHGPSAAPFGSEAFLALFALGKAAEAAASRVADRLASEDPAQSWASARIAARDGRRDDAVRLARLAISRGSRIEVVEAARAIMGVTSSPGQARLRIDEAASAMDAAIAREPRSPELLVMAGVLRHLQERYDDEAQLYRAAIDVQPSNPIARNNLAWVVAEDLGQPADGLPLIDGVIRDDGPDADRLGTRGVILMRLNRLPEAIQALEESVKLRPATLSSYYLALAYHKAGRDADSALALASARKAGLTPSEIDVPRRPEYQALTASSEAGR